MNKYQFIKIISFFTIFVLLGCTQAQKPQNVTPNLSTPIKAEFSLPQQF